MLDPDDAELLRVASLLSAANPFSPERKKLEKAALGRDYAPDADVWSLRGAPRARDENLRRIEAKLEQRLAGVHRALKRAKAPTAEVLSLYEDAVLFLLYHRFDEEMLALAVADEKDEGAGLPAPFFERFEAELSHWLTPLFVHRPASFGAAQLFAFFFQLRRAFVHVFEHLVGASAPAARLRASVWESLFTKTPRRYLQVLTGRMRDFSTLILGPTGSGKELVARAIGRSQFRPFDPGTRRFFPSPFRALSLSALSPTLIESELFGHARGSFTGADRERSGWLETVGPHGVVFLDEIGELDGALQVKLLRVLQTRGFQRIGETETRRFEGKIVAATHRDLSGPWFRPDLYYRLCSDLLMTPSLAEQLRDAPAELEPMLRFVIAGILGDSHPEAVETCAHEVARFAIKVLGRDYPWPGNFRELEQCARNVLLRGTYTPSAGLPSGARGEPWAEGARPLDEMMSRYVSYVFAETGSYLETARRLGVDRRTVKARIDKKLVAAWRHS